jgi:hypothetical protein
MEWFLRAAQRLAVHRREPHARSIALAKQKQRFVSGATAELCGAT